MSIKPLSFGLFTNFGAADWKNLDFGKSEPWDGKFHLEVAKIIESANFDFIFFADNLVISDVYGGNMDMPLRLGFVAPQHDPVPLATLIGTSTQNLGVVATMSTMAYHPFTLARMCSSTDHIMGGQLGWNIVTSTEKAAAENYGIDLPPRNQRYDIADEFMQVYNKLLKSWEVDAVVMDKENGVFANPEKVHHIDFKGDYFGSRGPLNTCPSPQVRPVCFQAGASPAGRDFAVKNADCVMAGSNTVEEMQAFRADMIKRCEAIGRDPDTLKIMFLVTPIIGSSKADAQAKWKELCESDIAVQRAAVLACTMSNIDLAQYDFDAPVPQLETDGGSGTLAKMLGAAGPGATLRQALGATSSGGAGDFVGTGDEIAEQMAEVAERVGHDGFLFAPPLQLLNLDYAKLLATELAPALQRKGLMRKEAKLGTFRDRLGLPKF